MKKFIVAVAGICMLLTTVFGTNSSVFAQSLDIDGVFEEILNEGKTEATVKMNLQYDQSKFQVDKIVQPDKSEIYPSVNEKLTSSSYLVKENSTIEFEVHYTEISSQQAKKQNFSYEVKSIATMDEEKPVEEESKNGVETEKANPEKIDTKDNKDVKNLGKPTAVGTKFTDVEESGHLGNWNFEIINEEAKEVTLTHADFYSGITVDLLKDPYMYLTDYDYPLVTGKPETAKSIGARLPSQVLYNGEYYKVTQISDGFGLLSTAGSAGILVGSVTVPNSVTKIGRRFLGSYLGNSRLAEVIIPDSVLTIGDNFLLKEMSGSNVLPLSNLVLSKNASYGNNSMIGLLGIEHFEIPENEEGRTTSIGSGSLKYLDAKSITLPSSLGSIDGSALTGSKTIELFTIWNTTSITGNLIAPTNAAMIRLVKSKMAMDLVNDPTYKSLLDITPNNETVVYGITEVSTTSDLNQALKKGGTTTFDIAVEKKIGNATTDTGDEYDKSWIDGGYTYTITGNTSTNTKMDGDKLTVGSDETATQFKVKATSKFDTNKSVEFTIDVDQTKEYVAQAIDYTSRYAGDNPTGKVVKKFETVQEALDFEYNQNFGSSDFSIVIELLTDVTVDSTLLISTDYQKTRFIKRISTAPSSNHGATNDPSLYTGASPDGRAVLKRGSANHGALIEWSLVSGAISNIGINISNIILDGGKSDGLTGDSLVLVGTTNFNEVHFTANNIKLFNNKNDLNHGGAIRTADGVKKVGSINLSKTEISECETIYSGGAVYIATASNVVVDESSEITGCYAEGNGGAIAVKDGIRIYITVSNSRLSENKADGNGGAIFSGYVISISQNTTITNNSSGLLGAGIYTGTIDNSYVGLLGYVETSKPLGGPIIISGNVDSENKGNIYINSKGSVKPMGTMGDDFKIGLTFEGLDKNGKNRMEPGASIGGWQKIINGPHANGKDNYMVDSDRNSLTAFYRDTNGQSLGYIYADDGETIISELAPGMIVESELVWPEAEMSFSKVDSADVSKTLENAEFTLYKCNDDSHDHSKDAVTALVKDSSCWQESKKVTSMADGNIDFGYLSTGQYMLVETKAPESYDLPEGQWYINVDNSPKVEAPQSYWDKVTIVKRGDVLPPDLTITLDNDNRFVSGQLTNQASRYRLQFNANTGTGTMADIHYGYNESVTLPANTFTKIGYEFTGWNTEADGSGQGISDQATSTLTESMILYAQWKVQGPSVFVEVPKAINLSDDTDGYAKKTESVRVIKDPQDELWYPDEDISVRASTSITLTNSKNSDEFVVSVFKADDSQYTDGTQPLAILNVKDPAKQSESFTLKTKINNSKIKEHYTGIMNFIIEFMP